MRKLAFILLVLVIIQVKSLAYSAVYNPFIRTSSSQTHDVVSKLYHLHYLMVKEFAASLQNKRTNILTKKAVVLVQPKINSIWISDSAENVQRLTKIISLLDVPQRQVLIKAKIIDVDKSYASEIGGLLGKSDIESISNAGEGWGISLHPNNGGIFTIPLLRTGARTLNYTLQALLERGHATLVAEPTLLTQNRTVADIEAGEEVPYQEKTGTGNTSVAFKKAVLRLKVTPIILPDNKISLQVQINQDQLSGLDFNGSPAIQTQQLLTTAVVPDGHSLLLGGIQQSMHGKLRHGIPVLDKLPVLGWLVASHEHKQEQKQLLVIITPKVIK